MQCNMYILQSQPNHYLHTLKTAMSMKYCNKYKNLTLYVLNIYFLSVFC